ncbi:hypothetical protein KAH55_14620, partial [bacterium]|nr:hypothetical protein [bacterium]
MPLTINLKTAFVKSILFLFLGISYSLNAQPSHIVLLDSAQVKTINYQRDFNTHQWRVIFNHNWKPAVGVELGVQETYLSSLIQTSSYDNKWKDNQDLKLFGYYWLTPRLFLQSLFRSQIFVDRQTGFRNDLNIWATEFGAGYRWNSPSKGQGRFSLSLGLTSDQRYEVRDTGYTGNGVLEAANINLGDYIHNTQINYQYTDLKTRENQDISLKYNIERTFQQAAADTISFWLDRKQHEYYVSEAGDVERFNEKASVIQNRLFYPLSATTTLSVVNLLKNRKVSILQFNALETASTEPRERTDFHFNNSLLLQHKSAKLKARLHLKYNYQEQVYRTPEAAENVPGSQRLSFIAPDNENGYLGLESNLGWKFNARDSMGVGTSISRLKYDTPDSSNFDDRDALRLDFRLSGKHDFSSILTAHVDASVNLYHLVYIFGERSADNHWNRIFKLRPQIQARFSPRFFIRQSFEVLANYVDYDYEFEQGDVKSFIYRKFSSDSRVNWQWLPHTYTEAKLRIEFEENGKLYWERWQE